MSRKVKLADVLWEAANRWLNPTSSNGWAEEVSSDMCPYSCHAVNAALRGDSNFGVFDADSPAFAFLEELGCDASMSAGKVLAQRTDEATQGARYMWLLLAMHVAEDEGIEIEVAS